MQVPLELSMRHLSPRQSRVAEELVREQVARLEHLADDIISCRVAVEEAQQPPQRSANPYRVRIRLTLGRGRELVVVRDIADSEPDEPMELVIRHAFDAMRRNLTEARDRRREHRPPEAELGVVVRLFPDGGYGFLNAADDGHEVYFHRHAVLGGDYDRLGIGTVVRFEEESGRQGPQATTVQIVDKPGSQIPIRGPVTQHAPRGWKRFETD
jgi:cold shock CspA family protein/ribosome-associated translation inhibitor RaiA